MRQPREDGLYGKEEYDRLIEIEDALTDALANADIKIAYVGRNTSNGCRDFCGFACPPPPYQGDQRRATFNYPSQGRAAQGGGGVPMAPEGRFAEL